MLVNAKILVTAATGSNGREVIRQLTVRGIAVRALVRAARRVRWESPLVQEAHGDLDDPDSLERAMAGIDKAFLITPLGEAAVRWCEHVFAAAKRAGVRHLVRLSAHGADEQAAAAILRQHGEADAMLRASSLRYTILRPNAYYQDILASAPTIKDSGRILASVGDARLSLVDVRDVAEAAVRVLTEPDHERRSYVLTGPDALSYRELARELSSALARPIVYQTLPQVVFEQAMLADGVTYWLANALTEIQAAFASGAFAAPTSDLEALLARPPRRLADFLRDYALAFR